jgi:hypothetical protein
MHKALYDWLIAITGYSAENVFRANQNGPQPDLPTEYATYNVISLIPRDSAYWKKVDKGADDDVKNQFTVQAIMNVSVNVYAEDGFEKLFILSQSNNLLATRDIFSAQSMTLIGKVSGSQDLTAIGDSDWRPRYQADFDFLVYTTVEEINQLIKAYQLTGEIQGDPIIVDGTF